MKKSALIKKLTAVKCNSAWSRGVREYAVDMVEYIEDHEITNTRQVLNGAENARQYSEDGCALVYDCDIAERLCNTTELIRSRGGKNPPNNRESWIGVQSRAIYQALILIEKALKD